MANRPSGYVNKSGPYAGEFGLPDWPDLNYLHMQLMRAPRVDEVEFILQGGDPPMLTMEFFRKDVKIGYIHLFKDKDQPRTCVFGTLMLIEEERNKGTFKALCVGMLAWFDRGYFERLTSRGTLSESLEPRLHEIGLEYMLDPVTGETVLASDLTNKDSLLHQRLREHEEQHNV